MATCTLSMHRRQPSPHYTCSWRVQQLMLTPCTPHRWHSHMSFPSACAECDVWHTCKCADMWPGSVHVLRLHLLLGAFSHLLIELQPTPNRTWWLLRTSSVLSLYCWWCGTRLHVTTGQHYASWTHTQIQTHCRRYVRCSVPRECITSAALAD